MIFVQKIMERYNIPFDKHDLQTVFTHNSFSENNNSRLVFLGQYGFKGEVAAWVFANIAGTGTQLQQFLGTILSQNKLENYFDKWKISKVRIAENINTNSQKHIFVYAILGYIFENASKKELKKFIFNEFIVPNDNKLPENQIHKNQWTQLQFLCKQRYDAKPKIIFEVDNQKINTVYIKINEEILAANSSISYKYAKKKSITQALITVVEKIEQQLLQKTEYQENEKIRLQKLEAEKLAKKQALQQKHIERNEKHAEKMAEKRRIEAIKAKEKDKKRRENKQLLKEKTSKKGANTIYRDYTPEEIAAMSVAKRRNLQDRGIIPKGG